MSARISPRDVGVFLDLDSNIQWRERAEEGPLVVVYSVSGCCEGPAGAHRSESSIHEWVPL
jgi:hypothetical protein